MIYVDTILQGIELLLVAYMAYITSRQQQPSRSDDERDS